MRPDEAAVALRTSVGNVHVLAHRRGWKRNGQGRDVRYAYEDVDAELVARTTRGQRLDEPHPCKSS